jgi:hypothetical protein
MAFGKKTGGRKKGTPNKATVERVQQIAESGITPLEYLLQVMRADVPPELKEQLASAPLSVETITALSGWHSLRLAAAKDAAPYCHPKLAAVEVTGKDGKDLIPEKTNDVEVAKRIAFILRKGVK